MLFLSSGNKRVHAAGNMPALDTVRPAKYDKAAVAADHEICSNLGKDILKKDKATAADAFVSSIYCVCICCRFFANHKCPLI